MSNNQKPADPAIVVTISPNIPTATAGNPTYTYVTGNQQFNNPITWISVSGDLGGATPVAEKKKDSDGCTCKKCREFYPYAEPNQEDGTLICYSCRHGW